jgi:hypothetical protein
LHSRALQKTFFSRANVARASARMPAACGTRIASVKLFVTSRENFCSL